MTCTPQPLSLCIYLCFDFMCGDSAAGFRSFTRFRGTETLFRVDGEPEEKSVLVRGFSCHLLLLIPGQRVVVEWWGGSAKGGGASKR